MTRWCAWTFGCLLIAAAVVRACDPAGARVWLGLTTSPQSLGLAAAPGILWANLRVTATVALLATLQQHLPLLRPIAIGLTAVVLAANAALIGATIGAYGLPAVALLAHAPLELVALALAATSYPSLPRRFAGIWILLACAAVAETA